MKKYVGVFLVLAVLLSLFAGCAGDSANTPETTDETETEAVDTAEESAGTEKEGSVATENYNETSSLNMDWVAHAGAETYIANPWAGVMGLYNELIYDTLICIDAENNMTPCLAKDISVSDDMLTYTFKLEEGVKWHDGEPFTANDIAFSYNAVMKMSDSPYANNMLAIEGAQDVVDGNADTASGIKVVDSNTLTITLLKPDFTITKPWSLLSILPEHLLKDVDPLLLSTYEDFFKMPIGTGAYKVDKTSFPDYFTLVANEEYWSGAPLIKQVTFTSYIAGGTEAVAAAVIAGELDIAEGNSINDITTATNIIENNDDIMMNILPSNYQRQLFFNGVGASSGDYNNSVQIPEVRKAFNLLIDKEAIAAMYPNQGQVLTTWVNPDLAAYNSDIPLWKRDVATAKQMLDAAGFDYSKPIRIAYYYDDQTTKDIMDIMAANFGEAGITMESFLVTGDVGNALYDVHNFEMYYAGNCDIFPIANYNTLTTGARYDSVLGFVDEREVYNDLISQYQALTDENERKELGDRIQVKASEDMYILPLYSVNKIFLYNAEKVALNEAIFGLDYVYYIDWDIETWELLS